MSRAKNGSAIVFNFEDFHEFKKYKKREGSQADVDRLLMVFGDLNIDIKDRVHKNMTYNSMRERLKECKYIIFIILKVVYLFVTKNQITHQFSIFLNSYHFKLNDGIKSVNATLN